MADLFELKRRVLRIPVAGPAPNNTLVHVTGWTWQPFYYERDAGLWRSTETMISLFKIDGFQQSRADDYLANTQVSITAYLRHMESKDDQTFLMAVDAVAPVLHSDGTLAAAVDLAASSDGDTLSWDVYLSAYVLTEEPRSERPPSTHRRIHQQPPSFARERTLQRSVPLRWEPLPPRDVPATTPSHPRRGFGSALAPCR